MVQLPIFRVHYRTLEDYFCRVFRWDEFDFLMASGAAPGLVPEYNISPDLPPSGDASQRADALRSGRRTRDVSLILTVLCRDGYIPAGKYIVDTRPLTPPIEKYKALLRQTGTPESKECRDFRAAHRHDKGFTRKAAEIDTQVLQMLKEMKQ
ncbi:MAG: hypothetical protein ACOY3P_23960 [Planctomycetota bacterium]